MQNTKIFIFCIPSTFRTHLSLQLAIYSIPPTHSPSESHCLWLKGLIPAVLKSTPRTHYNINYSFRGKAIRFGEKLWLWLRHAVEKYPLASFYGRVDDDIYVCGSAAFDMVKRFARPKRQNNPPPLSFYFLLVFFPSLSSKKTLTPSSHIFGL